MGDAAGQEGSIGPIGSGEPGSDFLLDLAGMSPPRTKRRRGVVAAKEPETLDELCTFMNSLQRFEFFTLPNPYFVTVDDLVETIHNSQARHMFSDPATNEKYPFSDPLRKAIPALRRINFTPLCYYDTPTNKRRLLVATSSCRESSDELLNTNYLQIMLDDTVIPQLIKDTHAVKGAEHRIFFLMLPPEAYHAISTLAMEPSERVKYLHEINDDISTMQTYYAIITQALKEGASDIHIEPVGPEGRVRYRVDGILHKGRYNLNRNRLPSLISLIKTKADLKIEEKYSPQDGGIRFDRDMVLAEGIEKDSKGKRQGSPIVDEHTFDRYFSGKAMRVSVIPGLYGEGAVLRILDTRIKNIDLLELGFNPRMNDAIDNIIHSPQGFVIVTGPTGSGKSTSLYAMIQKINTIDQKILTVEDPIEMPMPGIHQTQVRPAKDYTFSTASRYFLRHDPDVMLIGEIRDAETARAAISNANTGHLVMATLHTNDAIYSLIRLQELGIENSLIASSLSAVIAQRLVRLTCGDCAEVYDASDELNRVFEQDAFHAPVYLMRGSGTKNNITCSSCHGNGYHGRSVIAELWPIGLEERDMILKGNSSHEEYLQTAMRKGMVPLTHASIAMMLEGRTTLHALRTEVLTAADFLGRRDDLVKMIGDYQQSTANAPSRGIIQNGA